MRRWIAAAVCVLIAGACSSDEDSSSKAGATACVPGVSTACTGPAGCAGGQVCREDGSGYGPCDCGSAQDAGADQHAADGAPDSASDASHDSSDASAACDPPCGTGEQCCAGACVSLTSLQHCGACNEPCDPALASACELDADAGTATCRCGPFPACPSGHACVANGSAMVCANLSTDPKNCGAPNAACADGEICSSGACACGTGSACGSDQACCGGTCVDIQTDADNCGGCNIACRAGENCGAGQCRCGTGPACVPPSSGFPPMLGQSCCNGACVQNSDTSCNCAACDVASGESCVVPFIIPGLSSEVCCSQGATCGGFPLP